MKKHIKAAGILFLNCLCTIAGFSQQKNWHHLDLLKDGVYGISLEKAYHQLLRHKKPDTIIVAVIDNGIDTAQEDLLPVLWRHAGEDGADGDKNGYRADVYGWNFLGGTNGKNISNAGLEYQRWYFPLRQKYAHLSQGKVPAKEKKEYETWLRIQQKVLGDSGNRVSSVIAYRNRLFSADSMVQKGLGRSVYYYKDIKDWKPEQPDLQTAIGYLVPQLNQHPEWTNQQCLEAMKQHYDRSMAMPIENPALKRKDIIGDNYTDLNDRYYGNNDLTCNRSCFHGTHVAGIIGAQRENGKGMDGIAGTIKIMAIRAVPASGDEYDKDVALAIRYAVDNGAKVINMSFAKPWSPERQWVEDAIKYAAKKDVLLVNGAGNDSQNIDSSVAYPTAKYIKGKKKAPNMITVGASGPDKENLIAGFSNYGQAVDVFAPGMNIYSTLPDNRYGNMSGTSMASPVVAGLAALLRAYYPSLSAKQVKNIIESSVQRIDWPVKKPGSQTLVNMKDLCKSGGIINACNAIELAEKIK